MSRMESLLWQQPGQSFSQRLAGMLKEATGVTQELNCEWERYYRKVKLIRGAVPLRGLVLVGELCPPWCGAG